MMSEPTVVDARLDKLERDNRRLKLTVGALLLALAAVPLIGAVMPEQIPEVIQAREFRVIDENGNVLASMSGGASGVISVRDENGNERAVMHAFGFVYLDENDTIRAAMTDGGIGYHDENGTRRALMAEGILYSDQNGTVRAMISDYGISYEDENGTKRAVMDEDGITYYDAHRPAHIR